MISKVKSCTIVSLSTSVPQMISLGITQNKLKKTTALDSAIISSANK